MEKVIIEIATVKDATIKGYYVGGIAGSVNVLATAMLSFGNYKDGLRKEDLSSSSYNIHISQVAVRETVSLEGNTVGGLVGVLQSGTISNCYTRARIKSNSVSAVKGGFAAYIYASSSEFKNAGGSGSVGIVVNCYAACTFSGAGKNYAITASSVHQYQTFDTGRNAGYCFNYVFDNDTDGNATFTHSSNMFASDKVHSKKSSTEMKDKNTYTSKEFSATYWNFGSDYPTLKTEK